MEKYWCGDLSRKELGKMKKERLPKLVKCICNKNLNLPMDMEHDPLKEYQPKNRYWIECDFCGKSTAHYPTQIEARKAWLKISKIK